MEGNKDNDRKEIFSERVRAGKRTYFFDVKATRSNDYYLTITESKRRYKDDGYTYEKHKIFLYKEDFNKFLKALNTTVDHVKEELLPEVDFDKFDRDREEHFAAKKDNGATTDSTDESKIESDESSTPSDESSTLSEDSSTPELESVPSATETESESTSDIEETSAIENELKWD